MLTFSPLYQNEAALFGCFYFVFLIFSTIFNGNIAINNILFMTVALLIFW
ncbi:hypothetical protein PPEP_b0992 [Pseudoalteromonas peptidolytica F12-50-A1]|uniref:Uncharacterized protein n=1 Tax=Pseudoalteromonas peptidolytica F12-50-A1 TaxID=1315280 RepID=A0A8I0MY49_9GAMM|nr:hypothetical protein [Pseudoalteromonas peptidolytica F12-50-A1]MBE0348561.1 hypothetical protein [Pseudoalteromonas peptidolytica F12-50-A1]MBE0349082.1 hypothetical protein [Pseudoalteromonas peptidolytica F12-50-A1]